jgi:hypothetical protein
VELSESERELAASTATLAVALWKRAPDKKALHYCRIE